MIVGCICWRWVRKLHSKRKGATVASSLNITLGQKQRQGCLTAFLVLMIIFYANAFLFFFVRNSVHIFANPNHLNQEALPGLPPAALPVLLILPLCYLISAIALFRWKKWGFWMCAATAVADCLIYLWFGDYSDSVLAGVVPLALYGVLHIGTETKGWTQLD